MFIMCICFFILGSCDFLDGFKSGFSSKTEKVEKQEK